LGFSVDFSRKSGLMRLDGKILYQITAPNEVFLGGVILAAKSAKRSRRE